MKVMDVQICPRCGGEHAGIEFQPFTIQPMVGGTTLTHWASCPSNGEPMMLNDEDEAVVDRLQPWALVVKR